MERARPTAVLVIAILHLSIGGMGVLCNLCATGQLVYGSQLASLGNPQQAKQQVQIEEALNAKIPGYKVHQMVSLTAAWLFTALLITAGLGLLQMRSWGRALSLVYASLSLLHKIATAIYIYVLVLPAYKEVFQMVDMPNKQAAQVAETIAMLTAGVMPPIMMIYPTAVLIVMLLPSVSAAFRDDGLVPDQEAEESA